MGRPAHFSFYGQEGVKMAANTASRVEALIAPTVSQMGYDLWDVRFLKEGASWYLRVYIDKPEGIDINDCTDVSHAVDAILDEADIIAQSYYFEVCSPGVERELTRAEHFEKMTGREVIVHLIRPVDGERDFCGTLSAFDGGVKIVRDGADVYFEKGTYTSVKLNDMI